MWAYGTELGQPVEIVEPFVMRLFKGAPLHVTAAVNAVNAYAKTVQVQQAVPPEPVFEYPKG
jgi:hypothetical protein